ncbi:unnamed protein product [Gongylonema pulchrum]|uniref:SMC_N domain-containing protein n=1 Tax=Gongylonema pulchrum TaxID=637853 RepID=A0A183DWZ3_9BILA|nr:unnamed protein product [Gongylonema pulchrum]
MVRRKEARRTTTPAPEEGEKSRTAAPSAAKRRPQRTQNSEAESDEEDLRAQMRNDVNDEVKDFSIKFLIQCGFTVFVTSQIDQNLLNMEIPPLPEPVMSADGSGQRLMITSIDVENFKSYYGKHVLGPFHHNFSAIIGPNGSGKSNVIDSLLFVFGYRASKIRSKKISVLIHSSAGRENISSCTVGVNFQKIIDLVCLFFHFV